MQLTAKLTQLLPLQTGTGKNGEWKKQDLIVETEGQYPKKLCISIWGEKIDMQQLQLGNMLKIDFDIESREYNGRWYTDVKAWKIEVVVQEGSISSSVSPPGDMEIPNIEEGDLPF